MAINFCCSQQILSPFLLTYNEAYRHDRIKENGRSFHSDLFGVLEWQNVTVDNLARVELRMWRRFCCHCLLARQALPYGLEREIILGKRADARSDHAIMCPSSKHWADSLLCFLVLFPFLPSSFHSEPTSHLLLSPSSPASFPEVLIVSRSSPSDWTHLFLLFLLHADKVTKEE